LIDQMLTQAFVSGQMDAQATEQEKWKVGAGGTMRALSQRIYQQAQDTAEQALAAQPPSEAHCDCGAKLTQCLSCAENADAFVRTAGLYQTSDSPPAKAEASPSQEALIATSRLHMAINVAWRRLGAVLPACDGPTCEYCAALTESLRGKG
jgi:hypothetical protein